MEYSNLIMMIFLNLEVCYILNSQSKYGIRNSNCTKGATGTRPPSHLCVEIGFEATSYHITVSPLLSHCELALGHIGGIYTIAVIKLYT